MRIVFMGTPDFALPSLQRLIDDGHELAAVYCQPDKPQGRHFILTPPPVKILAQRYEIPVEQPATLKSEEARRRLAGFCPELIVVAAYGKILPRAVLELPRYGCINVHASLLPKYRGGSPMHTAIIQGETESGVTIMQMDAGIDTGDILTQSEVVIEDTDTDLSLEEKLSKVGAELIVKTLQKLEAGTLTATKQDDSKSCYAKLLTKAMGQIDWNQSALSIDRQVRGLYSWPGAYTSCKGKMLKIWQAKPVEEEGIAAYSMPGSIAKVTKKEIFVQTGDGVLCLQEVQLEGKKRMKVHDFLLGCKVEEGEVLG